MRIRAISKKTMCSDKFLSDGWRDCEKICFLMFLVKLQGQRSHVISGKCEVIEFFKFEPTYAFRPERDMFLVFPSPSLSGGAESARLRGRERGFEGREIPARRRAETEGDGHVCEVLESVCREGRKTVPKLFATRSWLRGRRSLQAKTSVSAFFSRST